MIDSIQSEKNLMLLKKISSWLAIIVLSAFILHYGRPVFIPLSFALFISFVLYPVCRWLERKGVGKKAAIVIGLSGVTILLLFIVVLFVEQFTAFAREWPGLREKLGASFSTLGNWLEEHWGISKASQQDWLNQSLQETSGISMLRQLVASSAVAFVLLFLIPVYSFLILVYRRRFITVLERITPKTIKVRSILLLTINAYFRFIKGMIVVYLIVGILNSIGLLLLGVPHAILFGFIASVLTFIPYVGIMVASLLPITISWATYDSIWYPIGVILIFTFVQYLEANIIFPWAVSQKLKINTLILIVFIFTGGILWGGAGLILFIPFAAITKLIADNTPGGETLSILMGYEKNITKSGS